MPTITVPDSFGGADHKVDVNLEESTQFANRLRKVAKERRKWAHANGVFCYRIYEADLPDYNVSIDAYVDVDLYDERCAGAPLDDPRARMSTYFRINEYEAPRNVDAGKAGMRFEDVLAIAPVVLGVDASQVFCKTRRRDKGGSQYADNDEPFTFTTREGGLAFEVALNGYLDTGLFLDHRTTRMMVGAMAEGKRFLNLFAYTGSASVHAAAGGAACTVTVDLSQTYLEWARRNMAANGFDNPRKHAFQRGDAMQWLRKAVDTGLKFDLVFVDPPTFSNSKRMGSSTWDVQRDHVGLLRLCRKVLAPGGTIVFSNNLRSFKLNEGEMRLMGLDIRNVSAESIPKDFERNPRIHQCWVLSRK